MPAEDDLFVRVGPGVVITTGTGERLRSELIDAIAGNLRTESTMVLRAPSVVPRRTIERAEYLVGMPQLLGAVRSFAGSDRDHLALLRQVAEGADWGTSFASTDVVLPPAACHLVYECLAGTAVEPRDVEMLAPCFRHEPSEEPSRFQAFHMLEYVHLGSDATTAAFVERVTCAAQETVRALGIAVAVENAADPFFGRAAVLAAQESESRSKIELVDKGGVALASVNDHGTHFGQQFGITHAGQVARTACIGFGLERLMLAVAGGR